jgi:hypothetical protein
MDQAIAKSQPSPDQKSGTPQPVLPLPWMALEGC